MSAGARVLLAWELGGNLGHVVPLLRVASELRERGHRAVFALRDLSNALLIARAGFGFFAAPVPPRAPLRGAYASYAAMLSGEAFPSTNAALAAALGWRSILGATRADLLVADHAPLALLAARGLKLKVATLGAPFSTPVGGRPLPAFGGGGERARTDEEKLLARMNAVLDALRAPGLDSASELYRADATMVRSFAETDCFAPRPAADYLPPRVEDSGDAVPDWPQAKGPRVLVYLNRAGWLQPACDALVARQASAIVCAPKADAAKEGELARPGVLATREHCRFSALMEQADAVVCHGGHNTVVGSLLAGKPLVMIPGHMEQALTSARVVSLGAGVMPSGRPSAEVLAHCLDAVRPGSAARDMAGKLAERYRRRRVAASRDALERLDALLD